MLRNSSSNLKQRQGDPASCNDSMDTSKTHSVENYVSRIAMIRSLLTTVKTEKEHYLVDRITSS